MKNMSQQTKKRLVIISSIVICVVLIVLIGNQFKAEQISDVPIPTENEPLNDVIVENESGISEKETDVVVVLPNISQPESGDNGMVSSGTEQTIQPDVVKPEYTEEQLTNPDQKPNGEPVTDEDIVVDHEEVEQPAITPEGGASKVSGGLPGFDNVPNAGANKGEHVDGDGDINKQIGIMD